MSKDNVKGHRGLAVAAHSVGGKCLLDDPSRSLAIYMLLVLGARGI